MDEQFRYEVLTAMPAWKRWSSVKDSVISDEDVKVRAKQMWMKLGQPENADREIWYAAKDELFLEYLREKGYSGSPCHDRSVARHIAITQYVRRRKFAAGLERPKTKTGVLCFYCKHCGMQTDVLPSDYFFEADDTCSQCQGLVSCDWIKDAKTAHDTGVVPQENQSKFYWSDK